MNERESDSLAKFYEEKSQIWCEYVFLNKSSVIKVF